MVEIGYTNNLKILRITSHGAYLDGEDLGEILLPKKFLTSEIKIGDSVDVFLYFDSEDKLIATLLKPYTEINHFARLECVSVTKIGAFLSWGLDKDLLVPKSEQKDDFFVGKKYTVYVYLDDVSNRIVASNRLNRFLSMTSPEYSEGDKCEIFVSQKTSIGYKVIVDNLYWGMIYDSELYREVTLGEYTYGFVKKVRQDNKIDVMLEKSSVKLVDKTEQEIYERIKEYGGFLKLSDKSSPEEIEKEFHVSKKVFKKAIGGLYKSHLIEITPNGLKIV